MDLGHQLALLDAVPEAQAAAAPVEGITRHEIQVAQALQRLYGATHGTALSRDQAVRAVRAVAQTHLTTAAPPLARADVEALYRKARGHLLKGALFVGGFAALQWLCAGWDKAGPSVAPSLGTSVPLTLLLLLSGVGLSWMMLRYVLWLPLHVATWVTAGTLMDDYKAADKAAARRAPVPSDEREPPRG
jgi:hypothetical protein